jgi:hypothetical protein
MDCVRFPTTLAFRNAFASELSHQRLSLRTFRSICVSPTALQSAPQVHPLMNPTLTQPSRPQSRCE